VKAVIFLEGGGDTSLDSQCREGFRKLLESAGFKGKMPRLFASGSRREAYEDFKTAHDLRKAEYVGLLIDSEDPVADIEKPWEHLANRKDDQMSCPLEATHEQALLMATCMETWIAADRATLIRQFGNGLRPNALPALTDLESRHRRDVQAALISATKECKVPYAKGRTSFEVLGELQPESLRRNLPSFRRVERILRERLHVDE